MEQLRAIEIILTIALYTKLVIRHPCINSQQSSSTGHACLPSAMAARCCQHQIAHCRCLYRTHWRSVCRGKIF